MPGGRPKKTLNDLPKDWEKIIIDEMSEGASLREIDALLDISTELRLRFVRDYPDFSYTIKRGVRLSELWWERNGRKGLRDKDFNHVLWYMNMKNRFGWKDRHDVTTDGDKIKNEPIQVQVVTTQDEAESD